MSTCPWGWFILQHWAGLKRLDKLRRRVERRRKKENASKHRRERRWKWGLKRNESGLITGHPQLFFFPGSCQTKPWACRCGVQCKHTVHHAYLSQRRKQAVICALMTGEGLSAGGRGWNEQRRCVDGDRWGMGVEILNKIALVFLFFLESSLPGWSEAIRSPVRSHRNKS